MTGPLRMLPIALAALVMGACGEYSRVENAEAGDEDKPAIVPDRDREDGEGLASPETPDIHDAEDDDEEREEGRTP